MLVNLVRNAGHCASYDQVRCIDTALARHILDRYVANGYTVVPSTLMEKKFFQFAADNIDIIEETLDGKGTFHATQIAVFQRGKADQQQEEITMAKETTLKATEEIHRLQTPPEYQGRPNPKFSVNVEYDWFKPGVEQTKASSLKDLAWILTKLADDHGSNLPSWTGFNQLSTKDSNDLTVVSNLPIINAPAHERDTLWTVILRCMHLSEVLNPGQSTVLTLDEQLYAKANGLQWENPECAKPFSCVLEAFTLLRIL